jgi:hypothetical protein
MPSLKILIGIVVLLASCTGAETGPSGSSAPSHDPSIAPPASASLTITEVHYGGPLFTEGSISFVRIVRDGRIVFRDAFPNAAAFVPLVDDLALEPGHYRVMSHQRACDGSCDALDPPAARCSTEIDLNDDFVITIEVDPPDDCMMRVDPGADVGRSYWFRLSTHCGIGPIFFDGRIWVPRARFGEDPNPPPGWSDPFESGSIRLISERVLEFRARSGDAVRFAVPALTSDVVLEGCY